MADSKADDIVTVETASGFKVSVRRDVPLRALVKLDAERMAEKVAGAAEFIVDWDVMVNGERLPPTLEGLLELPIDLFVEIGEAVGKALTVPPLGIGKASSPP